MPELPSGTVTFLFTDIEDSTARWEADEAAMEAAVARHDACLRAAIEGHDGVVFKTGGDSFCAAFSRAPEAVAAALEAQRAVRADPAALPVRMALHTGAVWPRDGDYFGPTLNRVARILAAAHGGQTLLSESARDLARDSLPPGADLRDLGPHRLRDLLRPERLSQLLHPDLPADFPPLLSLEAAPNNLPQQLTSFVGRAREIAEVKRLLATTRLLTLTGAGGAGKTRLALQVAADLLPDFPDGVWLAELAPLTDPELVPRAVAAALHVAEEPDRPLIETLADEVRGKSLLLVLDNTEHMVKAAARAAIALLRAAPGVRILATGREPLNLTAETTWQVPPLSLPALPGPGATRGSEPDAAQVGQYEAVQLFVERARAKRPGFALDDSNAAAIARICRRLDGIPLALELAAALVVVLRVEQIAGRLNRAFDLLTRGGAEQLARHQTLEAAIQWSYDLLSPAERALLDRLSVFAGGWELEAAEDVCSASPLERDAILDLLCQLVNKSLVIAEEDPGGDNRFRLLETVRQFAQQRLAETGEEDAARERHRDYYLQLAEEAAPNLQKPDQKRWYDRLERELDNLRAALAWSVDGDERLRMAAALHRFWLVRGPISEGLGWLRGELARRPNAPPALRAQALNGAGMLACQAGDYDAATRYYEESLALRRSLEDEQGEMVALNNLGFVAWSQGRLEEARDFYQQSLDISRRLGDPARIALKLSNLGTVAHELSNQSAARALLVEAEQLQRGLGDLGSLGNTLHTLGAVEFAEGNLRAAKQRLLESLRLHRDLQQRSWMPSSLLLLAAVAANEGLFEHSAVLLIAVEEATRQAGAALPQSQRCKLSEVMELVRGSLEPGTLERARREGASISLEQAASYALGYPTVDRLPAV